MEKRLQRRQGGAHVLGMLLLVSGIAAACEGGGPLTLSGDNPTLRMLNLSADSLVFSSLGDTFRLEVTTTGSTGPAPSWASTDPSVATVDGTGLVRSRGNGDASIEVTAGSAKRTVRVRVKQHPSSIVVTPSEASLEPGGSSQLDAQVLDANGYTLSSANVKWSSQDVSVAAVSDAGLVTALAAGTATVVAASGPARGSAAVTVLATSSGSLASVALSSVPTFTSLQDTARVGVTATDSAGGTLSAGQLTWASSNSSVVSVSASGVVTAVANGQARVSARYGDVSDSLVVDVAQRVAGVTLAPAALSLQPGDVAGVAASARDAGGAPVQGATFAWSSADPSVASVDGNGQVTAVGDGTTTVRATSGGVSGDASVTVATPTVPPSVSIAPSSLAFSALQDTARLSGTGSDGSGNALSAAQLAWVTADAGVATVSGDGLVTATGGGNTRVIASYGGAADTAEVTVSQTVASIDVTPASATVDVGGTLALQATLKDALGSGVAGASPAWSSSDQSVATVDGAGTVTGVGAGSATITAARDGATGTATVTVSAGEPGVVSDLQVVSSTDASVTLRWTQVDDGTGSPARYAVRYGSPTISWGGANGTEISVDGTGVGTPLTYTWAGLASGTAYEFQLIPYRGTLGAGAVYSTLSNKAAGQTTTPAPTVTTVTVTPASASLSAVGQTVQLSATARDGGGNVVSGVSFQWASSNSAVATVSTVGMVTAAGEGTAQVTATGDGVSGSATVSVTPPPPPSDALVSEGFETPDLGSRGWFDAKTVAIADIARPGSPGTHALEWHWAVGAKAPQGSSRIDFTPSNSVYFSYWIKVSDNWIGSGKTYHPHMFQMLTTADDHYTGPSISHLTIYDELLYLNGNLQAQLAIQDALMIDASNLNVDLRGITEQRSIGGYNGQHEFDDATSTVTWDMYRYSGDQYTNYKIIRPRGVTISDASKGTWHKVESYWQLNSVKNGIGQQDGVLKYWVDGVLMVDRRDVYFRTGANPTMKFRTLLLAPYIGSGSPVDQTMWIDDLVVATQRP